MKMKKLMAICIMALFLMIAFASVNSATSVIKTDIKETINSNNLDFTTTSAPSSFILCNIEGKLKKDPPSGPIKILEFKTIDELTALSPSGTYYGSDITIKAVIVQNMKYDKDTLYFSARVIFIIVNSGVLYEEDDGGGNRAPRIPTISGPGMLSWEGNRRGTFTFYSKDPDGDDITYTVDWGYNPYGSSISTYSDQPSGRYIDIIYEYVPGPDSNSLPTTITVKAKASDGILESDWSPAHIIIFGFWASKEIQSRGKA